MASLLKPLEGLVGHFAIRRIRAEIEKARDIVRGETSADDDQCNCEARINYLLPCYHLLLNSARTEVTLDITTIGSRWYLHRNTNIGLSNMV